MARRASYATSPYCPYLPLDPWTDGPLTLGDPTLTHGPYPGPGGPYPWYPDPCPTSPMALGPSLDRLEDAL